MLFGAVLGDCAVFLEPNGAVFAFLRWQESCSVSFENMKTVNLLPGNSQPGSIPRGCLGLARDLVITDFEMPQMKGDELATRIKQAWPAQPVLMITAYAEQLGDSDNPVDALLNKPFHLEDLRRAMAELLS